MIHKTMRSILSVLLAALLLVASVPLTPAFADGGAVPPQSESGEGRALEKDDAGVYQIGSAAELQEFAKLVNDDRETTANAELTANIDLSEICGENIGGESVSWTPIGTSINNPYEGNFNGAGHTISGLYIDSNADGQGLFGYVSGSVQNLTVSGSVSGHLYVGGIAGQNNGNVINCAFSGSVSGSGHVGGVVGNNGGTVENCYNTDAVNSSGNNVGGVVGLNGGTVTNCYNTGSVNGSGNYVGGVVGLNLGSVENCYNTGSVSGLYSGSDSNVGGVVGSNGDSVENCYNTGAVNSSGDNVGGVVGQNFGGVENCYNTGKVTGSSDYSYIGGVVGYNSSFGNVTGCYFLQQESEISGIGGGSPTTGATAVNDLSDQTQFQGWDFTDTWRISQSQNRPVLQANAEDNALSGTGKQEDPYKIYRAIDLKTFRDIVNGANDQAANPNAHAKLMNNIDLSSVCGAGKGSWNPIGNSIGKSYEGTFNGAGHTISGLYIKNTSNDTDYQGLFGFVGSEGTVQNLTVDGTVSGNNVGGVVGYNSSGTVTNCAFSGSVSGRYYVGGVVGRNSGTYGSVTNCYNTGEVTGSTSGGVVGYNQSGTVENCYNTGKVSGRYVGGVVGSNSGNVTNCYNTDSITVTGSGGRVGGVVGYNNGTVKNCYNTGTGTVTGTGDYVGGVVGYNDSSASVANCYNTGTVSDGTTSGGVVGQNFGSGSVTNCYFLPTADVNKNLSGIGLGGEGQEAIQKTADEFRSGEVAYLLQGTQTTPVWGQSALGTEDSLPTLVALDKNAKTVYQVTLKYDHAGAQDKTYYTDDTATPSEQPSRDGYTFDHWDKTEGEGNTITFTAKWTENAPDPDPEPTPDPEPEEPPYSGKYSYEVSTSVGDHGSLSVDRYATEGDIVTIQVAPDQAYKLDELVVTANGKDVELTANGDGTYTFTMPSADVRITATFAEDPDWTEPEEPATDVSDLFIDIAPDAWYKDAVQYAYDNGLMTGVSDTEFAPEATTTRAMIVSILARLEGVESAQAAGFADVDDNDWYATAVNWAANVGVVNGYEDNTFKPNTAITREQLAAILMNYAAYKGEDVSNRADLTSYTDQPSTWAEEAMSWAVAEKLITGVTADTLQPQGAATRAQVAAILQRFLSE